MHIIYLLKNSINEKMYVGCTNNLNNRMYRHSLAKEGHKLSDAIKKYGRQNFELWILDSADNRKNAHELERKWIIDLNSMHPSGYNLRFGMKEWATEVKDKISKSKKGQKKTQSHKDALRSSKKQKMKAIRCIETGKRYESISDACRELGANKGSFSYFFRGITKSVKGFTYERLN